MKLLAISILTILYVVQVSIGARNGIALFNNTDSGIQGVLTLHRNAGLGTFLMGQLRNISCFNSTSATKNPRQVAQVNNCLLGLTVNNWRNQGSGTTSNDQDQDRDGLQVASSNANSTVRTAPDIDWRQTIFNGSNLIRLPNIREILNGGLTNPIQNLIPGLNMSANAPRPNIRDLNANNSCQNVGDVYNPRGNMVAGPFGILRPPGVMGNLLVNNGTGSLLMGPLELLTAGPVNLIGLPITIWMDSLHPAINGSTLQLQSGANNRILECSQIHPLNANQFTIV